MLLSILAVVAPTATHSGTGLTCDKDTYQRRLWCASSSLALLPPRKLRKVPLRITPLGASISLKPKFSAVLVSVAL